MRRPLALLVAASLLLAACGDDDGGSDDGTATTTASPPSSVANDAELDAALLTAADLGSDWTEDAGSRVVLLDDEDGPECLQDPEDDPEHEKAQVAFTFDAENARFPTLQQTASDYGDVATMTSAFEASSEKIDGCGAFTYGPKDTKIDGRIEAVDGPSIGDASRTWSLHLETQGFEFDALVLFARKGQHGLSLYYLSQDAPDLAAFTAIAEKAIAKL